MSLQEPIQHSPRSRLEGGDDHNSHRRRPRPSGRDRHRAEPGRGVISAGPPLNHPINEAEYRRVFASLAQSGVDGIAVDDEPENIVNLKVIIELAEKNRMPVIYPFKLCVEAGGLMS